MSPASVAAIDTPDLKLGDLRPGLADPVHDSQRFFRGLLTAMAHPGRLVTLEGAPQGPKPLDPATAAAALTLLDYDTPLWIDWIADTPPLRAYLKFHCGCPIVERSQEAARHDPILHSAVVPAVSTRSEPFLSEAPARRVGVEVRRSFQDLPISRLGRAHVANGPRSFHLLQVVLDATGAVTRGTP